MARRYFRSDFCCDWKFCCDTILGHKATLKLSAVPVHHSPCLCFEAGVIRQEMIKTRFHFSRAWIVGALACAALVVGCLCFSAVVNKQARFVKSGLGQRCQRFWQQVFTPARKGRYPIGPCVVHDQTICEKRRPEQCPDRLSHEADRSEKIS